MLLSHAAELKKRKPQSVWFILDAVVADESICCLLVATELLRSVAITRRSLIVFIQVAPVQIFLASTRTVVPQFALRQIILLSHLILSCVRVSSFCEKGEWFVVSCWDAVDQRAGRQGEVASVGRSISFTAQGFQWVWNRLGGQVTWNNLQGFTQARNEPWKSPCGTKSPVEPQDLP